MAQSNPVQWFDIPVKDLSRAVEFYENVFGVELSLNEVGPLKMAWFPMVKDATGSTGSLVKAEGWKPSNDGSIVYFPVSDIEASLKKVESKGGKMLLPKSPIGEHGYIAHFEDTEGNRIGFHSM